MSNDYQIPNHIAIVMDGNGRWAKKRGLPRTAGHKVGSETFRKIATYAKKIGVKYLTVYAFSTENWKRPAEEVGVIMGLLQLYLKEAITDMRKEQIGLTFLGDLAPLPKAIKALIEKTNQITAESDHTIMVNICLNYGGRNEIKQGIQSIAKDVLNGTLAAEDIDEALVGRYLYTKNIPDPDLVIRPSGEVRLSNFLLWQSAYAEFYFTDVLWPDFTSVELDKAIGEYTKRNRRFGGI